MADKPYREMSIDELRDQHRQWSARVDAAPGWSSAYFSCTQCEAIQRILIERGVTPDPTFVREVKYG